jgi:hypothetical protein
VPVGSAPAVLAHMVPSPVLSPASAPVIASMHVRPSSQGGASSQQTVPTTPQTMNSGPEGV